MTLSMALDNSFEIMNEDEMYDVNGGWSRKSTHTTIYRVFAEFGVAFSKAATLMSKSIAWLLSGTAVKMIIASISSPVAFVAVAYAATMILTAALLLKERGSYNVNEFGYKIFSKEFQVGFYVD